MKTIFNFKTQQIRYQGILLALCLCLSFLTGDFYKNPIFFLIGICFFLIGGVIILWMHPYVEIKEGGVLVSRIFFKTEYSFKEFKGFLKKRNLFRNFQSKGHEILGIDQRYFVIYLEDKFLLNKKIYVLSQTKNFDEFVRELGKKALIEKMF